MASVADRLRLLVLLGFLYAKYADGDTGCGGWLNMATNSSCKDSVAHPSVAANHTM